MSSGNPDDPEAVVLEATGRHAIGDAIAWLAEDHPMPAGTNWTRLLQSLVAVAGTGDVATRAMRRVVKEAARSDVDTSKVVFNYENLAKASDYRGALDELVSRSPDGTLGGLTARELLRAQYANDLAVETLCLAAGVTHSDAKDWFQVGSSGWTQAQLAELLRYLNDLLTGTIQSPIPNSVPARAVELMPSVADGWRVLDTLQRSGVPYEVLLAQRAVGGAWLAHKNTTSSFPNMAAADALCERLSARGIDFRRASTVGGSARQTDLQELSGIHKKQIGLVIVAEEEARFAVAFSSARDGGTARANGDGLMQIPVTDLPFALLLTGLGWASRPETDRLARRFAGRLFTERNLDHLVECIAEFAT